MNINTSNEAIDKVIIELYKSEVDAILIGTEHFIDHETLFIDRKLVRSISVKRNRILKG
ncbi:MAG: hypothetical protein E6094_13970 [Clostridium perfringens]|nr:hypothetical protein [Clostridium perfringens]